MRRLALCHSILTLCACGLSGVAAGEEAGVLPTLMSNRGELLVADALDKPLAGSWKVAKGEWKSAGGSVRVSELAADMHGAVARHPLATGDFVVQYSFFLDGAKTTTLSINDATGHCCRVLITPTSLAVQKDSHDHGKLDKAVLLDKQEAKIAPGEWHTLVAEVCQGEIVARVDGQIVARGQHDAIKVAKTNFGLTVAGQSVAFKNLRVWDATANADWPAAKKQLENERLSRSPAGK